MDIKEDLPNTLTSNSQTEIMLDVAPVLGVCVGYELDVCIRNPMDDTITIKEPKEKDSFSSTSSNKNESNKLDKTIETEVAKPLWILSAY